MGGWHAYLPVEKCLDTILQTGPLQNAKIHFFRLISTEGALRLPTTYDSHPIQTNPIRPTYSCEDDLFIEDVI